MRANVKPAQGIVVVVGNAGTTAGPAAGKCPPLAARTPQTGPRIILGQKMRNTYKFSEWNSLQPKSLADLRRVFFA